MCLQSDFQLHVAAIWLYVTNQLSWKPYYEYIVTSLSAVTDLHGVRIRKSAKNERCENDKKNSNDDNNRNNINMS